jgi:hypothetical protein
VKAYTTKDYKEACEVARQILQKVRLNYFTVSDVVNESFENGVFVFGKMRAYVLNEKRRNKASLPQTYICSRCKQIKAGMEFYYRTDYRMNFTYYIQPCIECHKRKYNSKKRQ